MPDFDAAIVALQGLPFVMAIYRRSPGAGDPEYDDVLLYVAVRPFSNEIASRVLTLLAEFVGRDGTGACHVHHADYPSTRMLVGARQVWQRDPQPPPAG